MEELIEICLSEGKVIQALNLGKVIQALNLGKEKHYLLLSITHWISPLFNQREEILPLPDLINFF